MGSAVSVLIVMLVVVAAVAIITIRNLEQAQQKRKDDRRDFNTKERDMAVAFLGTVNYKSLVSAAAREFVGSGRIQGPASEFWGQILAYIAKGGSNWVNAAREIIESTNKGVMTEFTDHGLTITYDLSGKGVMRLPQYKVRFSNDKGAWSHVLEVSRAELVHVLDESANVTFDVVTPDGESFGGTAEIIRAALKL